MEDSVFQRPMFNAPKQEGGLAPSTGIATVRSPRDTANELRNMFAPTVPVQSFQGGGFVRDLQDLSGIGGGGAAFPGGAAEVTDPLTAPVSGGSSGNIMEGLRDLFLRSRGVQAPTTFPQEGEMPPQIPGRVYDLPEPVDVGAAPGMNFPMEAPPAGAAAPARAAERPKGALELTLEGIRADRARLAEDKKQNAMLALMQAGLAMAAGRSPSAISNIAAGGQAGIAAFAGMEKDRRAEDAALRREETGLLLEQQRMRAQEERAPEAIRTYAALGGWDPSKGREGFDEAVRRGIEVSKSLEKDPETVRTFRALGGGDLMKGFEIFNADKKLQAAIAITKDITAGEADKRAANDYIRGQLMRARTGGGGFEGFSATPVR